MEGATETKPLSSVGNKELRSPSHLVGESRHRVNFRDDIAAVGESGVNSRDAPLQPEEEEEVVVNPRDQASEVLMQSMQPFIATPVILYRRRYGMLAMFAALGFMQCAVWNTWGPISTTVVMAYSPAFTSSTVSMLALWGPITCITGTLICTLLIQKKGMRAAMVSSTLLMALAAVIRCFSEDPDYFILTAHVSSLLNGLAGVVVGVAPGLVSTLWFPISSRVTATGVGCTFNQLGNAGGFFLGPYMVQAPDTALLQHHRAVQAVNLRLEQLLTSSKSFHRHWEDGYINRVDAPPGLFGFDRHSYDMSSPNSFIVGPSQSDRRQKGYHKYSAVEYAKLVDRLVAKHNISVAELVRDEERSLWNLMVSVSGEMESSFSGFTPMPPRQDCEACEIGEVTVYRNQTITPQARELLRHSIKNYMIIIAGLCVGLFFIILAFFEDQPPTPPIAVAQQQDPVTGEPRALRLSMASTSRFRASGRQTDSSRPPTGRSSAWTGSMRASIRQEYLHFESGSVRIQPCEPDARLTSAAFSPPVGDGDQYRSMSDILEICSGTLRDFSFAMMVLAYSITLGVNVAWSSVLELNLSPLGVSQYSAGWIGTAITFGGVILALVMTRVSDLLFGHLKLSIMSLMLASTLCFLWFLLLANGCIPYSFWQLALSSSLAGSLNYAVSPLFFELAMELGFPAPEDMLGCIMTLSWNMISIFFLVAMHFLPMDDSLESVLWMNYVLVAQGVIVIALLFFVKEDYKRSGPIRSDMFNSTSPPPEHEGDGYYMSDDSDGGEQASPATRHRPRDTSLDLDEEEAGPVDVPDDVRLLADSSSDDGTKEDSLRNGAS